MLLSLDFRPELGQSSLFQLLADPISSVSVKLLIFLVLGLVSCFSASDKAATSVYTHEESTVCVKRHALPMFDGGCSGSRFMR